MLIETRTASMPKTQNAALLCDLVRLVNSQTQQQVQDLSIRHGGSGLVVTGRSRTYYVKQLVTQAILTSVPAVPLVNDIDVG